MDDIRILWGKTVPGDAEAYHPAVYHMLDAGMVAQALLSASAPPRWRRVLAASLSRRSACALPACPLAAAARPCPIP